MKIYKCSMIYHVIWSYMQFSSKFYQPRQNVFYIKECECTSDAMKMGWIRLPFNSLVIKDISDWNLKSSSYKAEITIQGEH